MQKNAFPSLYDVNKSSSWCPLGAPLVKGFALHGKKESKHLSNDVLARFSFFPPVFLLLSMVMRRKNEGRKRSFLPRRAKKAIAPSLLTWVRAYSPFPVFGPSFLRMGAERLAKLHCTFLHEQSPSGHFSSFLRHRLCCCVSSLLTHSLCRAKKEDLVKGQREETGIETEERSLLLYSCCLWRRWRMMRRALFAKKDKRKTTCFLLFSLLSLWGSVNHHVKFPIIHLSFSRAGRSAKHFRLLSPQNETFLLFNVNDLV